MQTGRPPKVRFTRRFGRAFSTDLNVKFLLEIGYHDAMDDRFCYFAIVQVTVRRQKTTPVNADSAKQ
jgi:hypothetical protein